MQETVLNIGFFPAIEKEFNQLCKSLSIEIIEINNPTDFSGVWNIKVAFQNPDALIKLQVGYNAAIDKYLTGQLSRDFDRMEPPSEW